MTLQSLRDLTKDDSVHCCAARIELHEGETEYHAINDEGYVIISCVTLNGGIPVWANLSLDVDESGRGIWKLPALGTEVLLCSDHGEFEGELYLVGKLPRPKGLPPDLTDSTTIVMQGDKVIARSVGGTAVPLMTKQDGQDLRDWVYAQFQAVGGHTHVVSGATTTGITTVAPGGGGASPPAPSLPPNPAGTTVLEGE